MSETLVVKNISNNIVSFAYRGNLLKIYPNHTIDLLDESFGGLSALEWEGSKDLEHFIESGALLYVNKIVEVDGVELAAEVDFNNDNSLMRVEHNVDGTHNINLANANMTVHTLSAEDHNVIDRNSVFLCDCASNVITIYLPEIHSAGTFFYIKKIDSSNNPVYIAGNGNLIDSESQQVINVKNTSLTLVSNGNDWFII